MPEPEHVPSAQKGREAGTGVRKPASNLPAIIGLAVVAVLIAGLLAVGPVLDGTVKNALVDAVRKGGTDSLNIGRIGYNMFSNTVVADNITLSMRDTTATGIRSVQIVVRRVGIAGVNWLRLLLGGTTVEEVVLDSATCTIDIDTSVTAEIPEPADSTKGARDSLFIEELAAALPERFSPLHIGRFAVGDAAIVWRRAGRMTDSIAALVVEVRDIAVDPEELHKGGKIWTSAELSTGAITTGLLGPAYTVQFDSLRFRSSTSTLAVTSLSIQPSVSDEQFFASLQYRLVRFRVKIPTLEFRRLHIEEYLRSNTLSAGVAALVDPHFDIVLNKRLPVDSSGPPPKMPHQFFDSLSVALHLDSLQFRNARILYTELFPYSKESAVLPFAEVNFDVTGIRHTPGRRSKQPVVIAASGRLADAGMLKLHVDIPLDVDRLRFTCRGTLGPMDPQALNRFLTVADRIRIASGKVDNADFSLSVANGRSTGVVNAEYTGLSIVVLDEETGSAQGLMPKLKTFIANAFALRANNPPFDKEQGAIAYEQKRGDAFMDVLWLSVRSGLADLIGF